MSLSCENPRPWASDGALATAIYVLLGGGYFTGISALIGVIIAHVKLGDETNPVLRSHYQFQVRTFWIGLLYMALGFLLCFVFVGLLVFAWWLVWSMVRIVKGAIAISEGKPIANPQSWLFG